MFNFDQLQSIIRNALVAGGAYFVTKGYVDQATLVEIVGGVVGVIGVVWGLVFHAGATKADLKAVVKGEASPAKEAAVIKKVV